LYLQAVVQAARILPQVIQVLQVDPVGAVGVVLAELLVQAVPATPLQQHHHRVMQAVLVP
jgi:hypothetical protein